MQAGQKAETPLGMPAGVEIIGGVSPAAREVLTPAAVGFIAQLARKFTAKRNALLDKRKEVQAKLDSGWKPDFFPGTKEIREGAWKVSPVPEELADRRVEITGPMDRKMVVNALNSGSRVYMADCEDAHSPVWQATLAGQANLTAAVNRSIDFTSDEGKSYRLNPETAVLFFRPRGWHLDEKHMRVDGAPVPASLFDFGLYFYRNAKSLLKNGSGPYFYLPKMENHLEANLWNDVFLFAQNELNVPKGTIKATVLIETILAAFEMHEILFELKDHSAGLNCGRWDYIFSFIKKFRNHSEFVLPDRALVTMDVHFLKSYSELAVQTCHKRGVHAMGGMAAQIPIKNDPEANAKALLKVRADKRREALAGHDGTWVAHPGLVAVAREVFDELMPTPNQVFKLRQEVRVTAPDLLAVPKGEITEQGLRTNIDVGIQYLASWLGGSGCVPIYNLMEDAATAEISRTQVWQWLKHGAKMSDGRKITVTLVKELAQNFKFDSGKSRQARELFLNLVSSEECEEFLTIPAYDLLP